MNEWDQNESIKKNYHRHIIVVSCSTHCRCRPLPPHPRINRSSPTETCSSNLELELTDQIQHHEAPSHRYCKRSSPLCCPYRLHRSPGCSGNIVFYCFIHPDISVLDAFALLGLKDHYHTKIAIESSDSYLTPLFFAIFVLVIYQHRPLNPSGKRALSNKHRTTCLRPRTLKSLPTRTKPSQLSLLRNRSPRKAEGSSQPKNLSQRRNPRTKRRSPRRRLSLLPTQQWGLHPYQQGGLL